MTAQQPYAVRFSAPAAKILDTLPEHAENTVWDVLELDPGCHDTLVVSWHTDGLRELFSSPYETTAVLWLALQQAGLRRPGEPPEIKSFELGFLLAPVFFLTPGEFVEAVDRLDARGFVERVGARGV
ncbi:hypothetical protein [Streptomyces sp. bgisy100]|uniref:hypothetical protein n=1 Tax=Streptomyces sp. bgisy100 TaxID=3413783 RepID=UPI003D7209A0